MGIVPEEYMRCVAFLTVDETDDKGQTKRVPKATAFFVSVRDTTPGYRLDYLVTARHCIEMAGVNRPLFARFNTVAGEFVELQTNTDDWIRSNSGDVAVFFCKPGGMPEGLSSKDVDGVSVSLKAFVGADFWWRGDVPDFGKQEVLPDVGHEALSIGLFTENFGAERNLPVARFGRISRAPSKVDFKSGNISFKSVAYLMEFQSWGGNSGSPVFFLYPINIPGESTFDTGYISGLLGLVSAHYNIESEAEKSGDILGKVLVQQNSGIAIVTPAEAIRQLLVREDVIAHRQEALTKWLEENPPP